MTSPNVTIYGIPSSNDTTDNNNIELVLNGVKPAQGTTGTGGATGNQWDSFHSTTAGTVTDAWAALEFFGQVTFDQLIFLEGGAFTDGGWFTATPTIEVRVNGTWTAVS